MSFRRLFYLQYRTINRYWDLFRGNDLVDRVYGLFRRWSVRWSFFVFLWRLRTIPVYRERERETCGKLVKQVSFFTHTHMLWMVLISCTVAHHKIRIRCGAAPCEETNNASNYNHVSILWMCSDGSHSCFSHTCAPHPTKSTGQH